MRLALAFSYLALVIPVAQAADDVVIADFEGTTYGDWKTTGEAFGPGPARGTLPGQMAVTGFLGKGLVNSFFKGDDTKGTLTSPAFKVQRKYINFLIGGGKYPGETCINMRVDGKIVRTATGPNDKPGGSEELDWHSWDVTDLASTDAVIEIVDSRSGGWGHINVDHIVQSDARRQSGPASREIVIDKKYLHLPVKTGAPMKRVALRVDGKIVREFDIELSDDPGFFAFVDVSAFKGKTLTVTLNKLMEGSKSLEKVVAADELPAASDHYKEKLRPQFHFTSRRGWLNDPNGLVYLDGEYHLFYQHNPYGWNWGNLHWGHAVSKDLIRWKELPPALYPPRHGDWCFSGSAAVDKANTGGWKTGTTDVLVAAFTSTGRGECIVFSNDYGRTWSEYEANPVVKHQGRDPKLIWHGPTNRWVMAVYDEFQGKQWIAFHSSPDLKKWTFESRIEGFYECPDLFEIVAAKGDSHKWVLYAADGKYVLGDFDGKKFTPDGGKHQLWWGNFYAAQTYSDAPNKRRIQIGWGQGIAFSGMPFNQQMTIPVDLQLQQTADGPRLFARPVDLDNLTLATFRAADVDLTTKGTTFGEASGELLDIRVEFDIGMASAVGLSVRGTGIVYDVKKQELACRNVHAPLKAVDGKVRMRVLVDRGSIEVFGNDGRVAISVGVIHPEKNQGVAAFLRGGPARATSLEVRKLKSAWE